MTTPRLAIETSTLACSVAVQVDADVILRERHEPGAHASHIMGMIDAAFEAADTTMTALEGIVYGRGPGSFTGVRIAVALAQGLAAGIGVPVLGVSSLAMLAQSAHASHPGATVLVVQDARMGELYVGRYAPDDRGLMQPTVPDSLLSPEAIETAGCVLAVGGAIESVPGLAARLERDGLMTAPELALPSAREALALAAAAPPDRWTGATQAAAVYLREQVASVKSD